MAKPGKKPRVVALRSDRTQAQIDAALSGLSYQGTARPGGRITLLTPLGPQTRRLRTVGRLITR